ncbi:MAG: hypothetical protein IPJ81_09565 [Chitinophagaceae bacterium]|nr:hypothetical protein [Chitinophagaceae bacterium]
MAAGFAGNFNLCVDQKYRTGGNGFAGYLFSPYQTVGSSAFDRGEGGRQIIFFLLPALVPCGIIVVSLTASAYLCGTFIKAEDRNTDEAD